MALKESKQQILKMSSKMLAKHLEDITQTPICKDKKYCYFVTSAFLKAKS